MFTLVKDHQVTLLDPEVDWPALKILPLVCRTHDWVDWWSSLSLRSLAGMEVMRGLLRAYGRIKENAKAHGMLNTFLKLRTVIGEVGTVTVLIQKRRLREMK